jgi:hypothetical protein
MFILKVIQKFEDYNIPYAVVGGHAVALHGAVRGTVDIDFITAIQSENLVIIEKALSELGLTPVLPLHAKELYDNKDLYMKERNLVAWGFVNQANPLEHVDIIITEEINNENVETIRVKNMDIKILSKNALIAMKKRSGREQDLVDIEALERIDGV